MGDKIVALLTSEESFLNNYGAALQGYALSNAISKRGYRCKIVRYKGLNTNNMIQSRRLSVLRFLLLEKPLMIKAKIRNYMDRENRRCRSMFFQRFQDEFMLFYNQKRIQYDEIRQNPPPFNTYVCGSDQIWNPKIKGNANDPGYFLYFGKKEIKRIAYAPSIGIDEVPENCKSEMKKLIDNLDFVSVREKTGAKIIENITGKKVPVLLDPTLLLEQHDWRSISLLPKNIPDRYIFCYKFGNLRYTSREINRISRKMGLPVLTLPMNLPALNDNFRRIYKAGPSEFIGLIMNAELVVTDSFHATVFSIIFKKPFLTFYRENPYKFGTMNSRLTDMLSDLKLLDRLIMPRQKVDINSILSVDYSFAEEVIHHRKKEANNYLDLALKG